MQQQLYVNLLWKCLMKDSVKHTLISHQSSTYELNDLKEQLQKKTGLALPLEEELKILEELQSFELGQFLLANKGLDGFWTAYVILHGPAKKNLDSLEHWILHEAPAFKATQERFRIFQRELQQILFDGIHMASVPCGLMDDLLTLDFSEVNHFKAIGMDLDPLSLELAKKNARFNNISNVEFIQKDAWDLNIYDKFDVLTSNGLNIYESDDNKVTNLYQQFYQALKPDGILITSFVTPPPGFTEQSTWKNIELENLLKQQAIFTDIIQANWQAFRTESTSRQQLTDAGFSVEKIIYDTQGIFPTVVARKV